MQNFFLLLWVLPKSILYLKKIKNMFNIEHLSLLNTRSFMKVNSCIRKSNKKLNLKIFKVWSLCYTVVSSQATKQHWCWFLGKTSVIYLKLGRVECHDLAPLDDVAAPLQISSRDPFSKQNCMFFNKGDATASLYHHCYCAVLLTRMDTFLVMAAELAGWWKDHVSWLHCIWD